MDDWTAIRQIKTDGPGFFPRSHGTSPHVWAAATWAATRWICGLLDTAKG